MRSSIIARSTPSEDAPAAAVPECPAATARETDRPAVRRFSFDAASSPLLTAALAWDAAGPRR